MRKKNLSKTIKIIEKKNSTKKILIDKISVHPTQSESPTRPPDTVFGRSGLLSVSDCCEYSEKEIRASLFCVLAGDLRDLS